MYEEFVKIILMETGNVWNPYGCMVGFELAIWDGVQKVFPEIMIFGCLFHFKQATKRCQVKSILIIIFKISKNIQWKRN